MKLTAVFEPAKEGGYTCFVEEIPAAISQGETVEEAKANLPRCLEAGSRMPARAGREGAFSAGLARDDRIRWRMRLADLERHLRERGCVFHPTRWRSRHLVQKRAVWTRLFRCGRFLTANDLSQAAQRAVYGLRVRKRFGYVRV